MSAAEHDELTQARATKEGQQAEQGQQAPQAQQAQQGQQAEQAQQVLDNEAWEAAALAEASENAPNSPRLRKNLMRRDSSKATIPDSLRAQIDTPNTCRRVVERALALAAAHVPTHRHRGPPPSTCARSPKWSPSGCARGGSGAAYISPISPSGCARGGLGARCCTGSAAGLHWGCGGTGAAAALWSPAQEDGPRLY